MRYVKTYESFKSDLYLKNSNFNNSLNLNESLLDDIINFFKNIWDYLKEKASDVVEFLGDKWNEFKDKVSELGQAKRSNSGLRSFKSVGLANCVCFNSLERNLT